MIVVFVSGDVRSVQRFSGYFVLYLGAASLCLPSHWIVCAFHVINALVALIRSGEKTNLRAIAMFPERSKCFPSSYRCDNSQVDKLTLTKQQASVKTASHTARIFHSPGTGGRYTNSQKQNNSLNNINTLNI